MRPLYGVSAELAVLAAFLGLAPAMPSGLPFAVYVLVAEVMSTYLLHCPAHYIVGGALGIRFRHMGIGRTTLARILPGRAARLARLMPVLTLWTEKASLAAASKRRAAAMYASGTIASVSSALAIAIVASLFQQAEYSALAWTLAAAYLAFDGVFSPRGGDLERARRVLRA